MATNETLLQKLKKFDHLNVLIVMALKEESQGILESQGFKVLYTGMGLVNSSFSLAHYLGQSSVHETSALKPDLILNLGTAGTFNSELLHQLVRVESTSQRGEVIKPLKQNIVLDHSAKGKFENLPIVHCASADFVSQAETCFVVNSELIPYKNNLIFDMEVFSLAVVAQKFSIPLVSVKYITDLSDHSTYAQWKSQLDLAAKSFLNFLMTE